MPVYFSPAANVGFAHYTKTAGTSLQRWFRRMFPDGDLLERENPHLPVQVALERIRGNQERAGWRWLRSLGGRMGRREEPLIVGVIREPLEMLVSLFEYWRRHEFPVEPTAEFILAARRGTFPDFLRMAVVDGHAPTYEWFFDVGGRAWNRTRLIDFAGLDRGLEAVARELGIGNPPPLERHNAAAAGRDLDGYRSAAGTLLSDVRRHFRWYYEDGIRLAIGSPRPGQAA